MNKKILQEILDQLHEIKKQINFNPPQLPTLSTARLFPTKEDEPFLREWLIKNLAEILNNISTKMWVHHHAKQCSERSQKKLFGIPHQDNKLV